MYNIHCNCSKGRSELNFNEILELRVAILDMKTKTVVDGFHTHVRPTIDNKIAQFITDCTGITNDICFDPNVPTFEDAIAMLHNYLDRFGMFGHEFVFMSQGDFEGNQIQREAEFKNFALPSYL